ncbi:MAG: hypothetical protein HY315_03645 [Acidobacteria bacterium]|nr:hypothetical protein [Acidobacteriota bacterium]
MRARNYPVSVSPSGSQGVLFVLLLSGLFGFCMGLGHATMQIGVQSAQVLSGVVQYPRALPFYVYHVKLWALTNQICALLLYLGVSERMLSLAISGLMGMLSFQALALCTFALSQRRWLALASPFLAQFTSAFGYNVAYAIYLMGTSNTYGVVGLSSVLLILALFANERYKTAALFLGIMPSVHASMGFWCWLIVLTCFLCDFRHLLDPFRRAVKYFLAGFAISLASFGIHLYMSRGLPSVHPNVANRYLSVWVRYWDVHRRPVDFHLPGVYLTVAGLILCLIWLVLFRKDLTGQSRFLLRALTVSGVVALGFAMISWLPPERVPGILLVLMPTRLFNLNIVSFMALLLGLLGLYKDDLWAQLNLAFLVVFLWLVTSVSGRPRWVATAMLLSGLALLASRRLLAADQRWVSQKAWLVKLPSRFAFLIVALVMIQVSVKTAFNWNQLDFRDWTDDPLFREASLASGLLLPCSDMTLMQFRTRRPVLLEPGTLDILNYTLEAGPEMNTILREVYGVDLFSPPPHAERDAAVPTAINKAVWESRSSEQWKRVGMKFGVTQVITYAGWNLELPQVSRNKDFSLYRIPD